MTMKIITQTSEAILESSSEKDFPTRYYYTIAFPISKKQ